MAIPEYPLEQLAQIKKRRLEEAEKTLFEKKQILAKEQEKLLAVEEERDKVLLHKNEKLHQLRETLDAGSTSDKIQQMKQYLKIVDEQLLQKEKKVKEQQKHVEEAEKQVEKARQDLFKKQQDVEKIQMHHGEWEKDVKKQMEQKEALEADEIGSTIHSMRKKHPSYKNHLGAKRKKK